MLNINTPIWMHALETQLNAIETIERVFRNDRHGIAADHGFAVDRALLPRAVPFAFTNETLDAIWAVSQLIPNDTRLNKWNLDTEAVWWYFETPLQIETLELEGMNAVGVRVLCFGWMDFGSGPVLGASAWCESHGTVAPNIMLTPSQTWTWQRNETIVEVVRHAEDAHRRLYGPGGKWKDKPTIGVDKFVAATNQMTRFILAALAWLDQKIIVSECAHVERHRRKAFNKATAQNLDSIQVIKLRKTSYTKPEDPSGVVSEPVEWSCRWIVSGHWKNQPCGPALHDRKLIYIMPFPKGPDDKPFKTPRKRVYTVDR